jgi:hypothetical protein
MKRMTWMTIAMALLVGVTIASAQSLGDAARANRKTKSQTSAKHFDNDNLPTNQPLSVVGPEPSAASSTTTQASGDTKATAKEGKEGQAAKDGANADGKAAEKKSDKSPEDVIKGKIDAQKQKVDELNKDLDITEREYRLRAVEMYSDAGNRLRNAGQWDKQDADYKKQIADKQAALDAAKQQLNQLEEQQRTGEAPKE